MHLRRGVPKSTTLPRKAELGNLDRSPEISPSRASGDSRASEYMGVDWLAWRSGRASIHDRRASWRALVVTHGRAAIAEMARRRRWWK
jgi:hypothetical protein